MGAATARSLAEAGRSTVILEQFEVGHTHGSSHGRDRGFTFAHPNPANTRMATVALPLWRHLEEEIGKTILTTTGGLLVQDQVHSLVPALERYGVKFEILEPDEVAARFSIALSEESRAVYQPEAGAIAAEEAVHAFITSATSRGAQLYENTKVLRISTTGEKVEVALADETYRASRLVVTAGAWSRDLLHGVGISLPTTPTRETVAYFRINEDSYQTPRLFEYGASTVYSGFTPPQYLKAGEHHAGPVTDPDDKGAPSQESIARLSAYVRERYPTVDPIPHHSETCIYTNTADGQFILERHGRIIVGSACNGSGFKFAPLIGGHLARLATSAEGNGA